MTVRADNEAIRVVSLDKDWFSYQYASMFNVRHIISRPQGEFHVCCNYPGFSRDKANMLVDAAITGKIMVIDLRDFSITIARKNGGK